MTKRGNTIVGVAIGLGAALLTDLVLRHDAAAQTPPTAVCFKATGEDKTADWITSQLAAGKTSVVGGGGYAMFFYCAW